MEWQEFHARAYIVLSAVQSEAIYVDFVNMYGGPHGDAFRQHEMPRLFMELKEKAVIDSYEEFCNYLRMVETAGARIVDRWIRTKLYHRLHRYLGTLQSTRCPECRSIQNFSLPTQDFI